MGMRVTVIIQHEAVYRRLFNGNVTRTSPESRELFRAVDTRDICTGHSAHVSDF